MATEGLNQADALRGQLLEDEVKVSLTTTTARSAILVLGAVYVMTCDTDCFIKQGGSAVDAATATSSVLYARERMRIKVVDATNAYVAGIVASGTATLRLQRWS
jgi:hypothetical protein